MNKVVGDFGQVHCVCVFLTKLVALLHKAYTQTIIKCELFHYTVRTLVHLDRDSNNLGPAQTR